MEKKFVPIKPVPTQPKKAIDPSDLAKRVGRERDKVAFARSSAAARQLAVRDGREGGVIVICPHPAAKFLSNQ